MHLEVRHLRLVVAIAERGSVTRAAERLNLTQSAVSHQLRDIETRLGAPLFHRLGKRMELAPAGERVLEAARGILAQLEQVEADVVRGADAGPAGVLRLTTECYTCYHWLPDVLARYRRDHPRVEVRVVPEATRRALRALHEGELDVAIVTTTASRRRFTFTPLFDDELVVVAHPDHPIAQRQFVRPEDFRDEPLVLYSMPDEASTLLHEILRPAGVRPGPITRVQLTEGVVELVKAGFGLATLARWAIAPHVAAGTLAAVPLGKGGYRRRWYAATRATAAPSLHVSTFVHMLRATPFDAYRREPAARLAPARAERGPRRSA